jgi:hypothetical protein
MPGSSSTDGMVIGENVQVCVEGVMSVFQTRLREMLNEEGIEKPDPNPGEWYSMEKFVTVLNQIETDAGENALRKVGEATPQFVDWPDTTESPGEALAAMPHVFDTVHRGLPGGLSYEETGSDVGEVNSSTPYPQAWEKGFIKGTAEEFGSPFTRVEVVSESRETTRYEVFW